MIEGLINIADFARVAAEKLDAGVAGYFFGGAGDELTLAENVAAWKARVRAAWPGVLARRLDAPPGECYVVGDAVWDLLAARRAGMLSIGLLSGGYGSDEPRAGRRVLAQPMHDPAALAANLASLGPAGSATIAADGSVAAFVPAGRALTWQLTDPAGEPVTSAAAARSLPRLTVRLADGAVPVRPERAQP